MTFTDALIIVGTGDGAGGLVALSELQPLKREPANKTAPM
jgi:hypothetical protein